MRIRGILFVGTILFFLALIPCLGQEKGKPRTSCQAVLELPFPMGGVEGGPETATLKTDLSMHGPGGARFVYIEDKNLEPRESTEAAALRIPGPGEPGFVFEEQKNLYPGESNQEKKPPAKEKTKK